MCRFLESPWQGFPSTVRRATCQRLGIVWEWHPRPCVGWRRRLDRWDPSLVLTDCLKPTPFHSSAIKSGSGTQPTLSISSRPLFIFSYSTYRYLSLNQKQSHEHSSLLSLLLPTLQASYLVGVSDPNSQSGQEGLVDPIQFARANQAIQMACQNLVDPASSPSQVRRPM